MRLSTRNQLHATVQEVTEGSVMATVKLALGDGQTMTAAVTREAVADLELAPGDAVTVLVKATEVMLGKA
jgi:molybdopterin-binding protein